MEYKKKSCNSRCAKRIPKKITGTSRRLAVHQLGRLINPDQGLCEGSRRTLTKKIKLIYHLKLLNMLRDLIDPEEFEAEFMICTKKTMQMEN